MDGPYGAPHEDRGAGFTLNVSHHPRLQRSTESGAPLLLPLSAMVVLPPDYSEGDAILPTHLGRDSKRSTRESLN